MTPSQPAPESGAHTEALGPEHPRQIGPYRILRVLGEGGIGLVYLADQSEPVRRRVAVKVIKVGMDTHQVVARFESERQALAVMNHPNIAKVLDAGAADNGRPYFVMEVVQGVPITDYCDTERFSTDERVALFLDVCAALQHAHQKGVVHRDLKPSNLLVGLQEGKPFVKVIDFGIAKAMGHGLTSRTLVTRVGQLLGTPAYMSPEQAEMSGVDLDTRTDIYSLGVVLYELLSGALPLELGSVPDYALPHALRDTDVPPLSARLTTLGDARDAIARHRRTDAKRLGRELRGDLDWIVAKAMEKDRTRRYETVESFAADLRRHLEHLPVLARPRSPGYVFTRFLKRHKAGVAAGAAALLALAVGAVLATAGFVRATRAEHEALQQAQTAQRTAEFLVNLFEVSNPSEARGNTVTAREILDRGAERIRTDLADQPDVQSTMMDTIGSVYHSLGLFEQSMALLDESLAIRRKTFGDESPQVLHALISLGKLRYQYGDTAGAESTLREALALGERLNLPGDLAIGDVKSNLGMVLASYYRREYAAAVELLREALSISRRERGTDDPTTLDVQYQLGLALYGDRRLEEAEIEVRDAIAVEQRVFGGDGPEVGDHAYGLAEILSAGPQRAEAERLYRFALDTGRRRLGDKHVKVAFFHRALGLLLLLDPTRYADAETEFREALLVYDTVYPDGHRRVAHTMSDLGLVLLLTGRSAEAERELRDAAVMLEQHDGAPRDNLLVQARLADLLVGARRYDEARVAAERARAYDDPSEEDLASRAYASSALAAALAGLGRREEAEGLTAEITPALRGHPFKAERLAMRRAFALYAEWAPATAVAKLRSDLVQRGFDGLTDEPGAPVKSGS